MNKGTSLWSAMLLGAGLLVASANGLAAAMYKWTDSEGNVQYTQDPPPQGGFQTMAPPPPAPAAAEPEAEAPKASTGQPAGATDKAAAKEEAERKELAATIARKNCETARKNLEIYTTFRRVMNEQGEIVTMGDDERAAKLKEANDMIKKFCQ